MERAFFLFLLNKRISHKECAQEATSENFSCIQTPGWHSAVANNERSNMCSTWSGCYSTKLGCLYRLLLLEWWLLVLPLLLPLLLLLLEYFLGSLYTSMMEPAVSTLYTCQSQIRLNDNGMLPPIKSELASRYCPHALLVSAGNLMSWPWYPIRSAAAAIDLGSYHRHNGSLKLKQTMSTAKNHAPCIGPQIYLSVMKASAACTTSFGAIGPG